MAIGTLNAYATDSPLAKNYIGEAMTNVEDNAFKYREEQRLNEAKKEAERKASMVKDSFDPKVELTGNQSVNDLSVPFAMQSKQMYADNVNKINGTTDINEKNRLLQANNRIKQNFDTYAQLPAILNDKMAAVLKGVQEDKLNPRDAERAAHMLDSLNSGKAKVKIDDYGVPRLTTYKVSPTGELELDAQGNPIVLGDNQDMSAMVKSFEVHPNSTYDADLLSATDKFKLDKTGWETNGNKITREIKDQRTSDTADAFAQAKVSQPHERYELSQRTGIPETDVKALTDVVAKQFKDKINETNLQDHDYAFDSNARANRKLAKEAIIIGKPSFISKEGEISPDIRVPKGTKSFPLGNVIMDSGQGKKQKATNIYVSPKGQMFLKVEETGFEGGSESRKELTDQGNIKQEKFEKWLKSDESVNATETEMNARKPSSEDYITITESNKSPKITMLDFGKDDHEIGRYALKMGFNGAKGLQDEFIRRSGGDKFFKSNPRPNQAETYTNVQEGNYNGNTVKIGYKNGKWFDINTGKEIK